MPLHDGQKRWLKNSTRDINLLSSGNRYGKSVVTAVKHIWKNFYKHGMGHGNKEAWLRAQYRTANLAPHSKNLEAVFNSIEQIMTSSFPIPQADGTLQHNRCKIGWFLNEVAIRRSAPLKIPFVNNSYVDFASTGEDKGSSIQGKPYGYISFDEGGRDHHMEYTIDSNITSRLTDWQGTLDIPCTPDAESPSIVYHKRLFTRGMANDPGVYSQEGSVYENTFLSKGALDKVERKYAGTPLYDQVVHGKFVIAGSTLFSHDSIIGAGDDTLNGGLEYEPGHSYTIGVDTAIGSDEQVYTVLRNPLVMCPMHDDCRNSIFVVARQVSCVGNTKAPGIHMYDFIGLVEAYRHGPSVRICLETWNGEAVRFYKDMPRHIQAITKTWGSFTPDGVKRPKGTAEAKKTDIIISLIKLLTEGKLKIPNEPVLNEQLSVYRMDDKNLETDRVISLSLAAWLATDGKPKISKLEAYEVEW